MNIEEFKSQNVINSEIPLKDGRVLLTTKNGFVFWIANKKGIVEITDEATYNHAKIHRITKRIKNKK